MAMIQHTVPGNSLTDRSIRGDTISSLELGSRDEVAVGTRPPSARCLQACSALTSVPVYDVQQV
jgi:hypothetical protein